MIPRERLQEANRAGDDDVLWPLLTVVCRQPWLRRLAAAGLVLGALAVFALRPAPVRGRGAACHYGDSGVSVGPDRTARCTPGLWISDPAIKRTAAAGEYDPDVSHAHVCSRSYNPRPAIAVSEPLKREALFAYGLPPSARAHTEADHLDPRWLGGATVRQNIWPEPDYAHPSGAYANPKDVLEAKLYRMTCEMGAMTVGRARRIFAGDWRRAYRRYVSRTITGQ